MILAAVMLLISSCATLSSSGVERVKEYTVESARLPRSFDGFRVAFISDTHYPSLFNHRRLHGLVSRLKEINPDVLFLGGDYVADNDSVDVLFSALATVAPSYGTYAVLGNHERRNETIVESSMRRHGITLLADSLVCLANVKDSIYLIGVRDSFSSESIAMQSDVVLPPDAYLILLAHTPDYVERSGSVADLAFSGHTHGGQVSLFGLYTPVKNTLYGTRFLRGLNSTTSGTPVITTTGVGTSRRKIRFCVPSEIVVVTLKSGKSE